jgi:DNA-binding NarL/FixJ family response regulator
LLGKKYDVIGIVPDGRELLAQAPKLKPNVIVLDIGMPLLNGLDAGERLKSVLTNVKLVFLTMQDDPNLAAAALNLSFALKGQRGSRRGILTFTFAKQGEEWKVESQAWGRLS